MIKLFSLFLLLSFAVTSQLFAQDAVVVNSSLVNESSLGLTSFKSAQNDSLDTDLYFAKHTSEFTKADNKYSFFANYFYGKTGNELTARSWLAGLRYDRSLSAALSLFISESVEGNRFLSYVLRSNTDIGAKYFWELKTDDKDMTYGSLEAGYRLTYEDRVTQALSTFEANSTSHKARLYSDNSYAWSETFSTKLGLEYLKTIGNDNREQINAEIAALNKLSALLSFKASYLINYDDTLKDQGFSSNSSKTLAVSLIANY